MFGERSGKRNHSQRSVSQDLPAAVELARPCELLHRFPPFLRSATTLASRWPYILRPKIPFRPPQCFSIILLLADLALFCAAPRLFSGIPKITTSRATGNHPHLLVQAGKQWRGLPSTALVVICYLSTEPALPASVNRNLRTWGMIMLTRQAADLAQCERHSPELGSCR